MKLLINLCGHDGIISHYAGVGTIVKRYIEVIRKILDDKKIDYHLNLFTLEFNKDSMGYNKKLEDYHKSLDKTSLYILSNGSNGETSFGSIDNWYKASINTAKIINNFDFNEYDYVINLCNDTPYAYLVKLIKKNNNCITTWIPHSTGLIYDEDMSLSNNNQNNSARVKLEKDVINYINSNYNTYCISTGIYIKNHLINKYGLKNNINIINGELLYRDNLYIENDRMKELFNQINKNDSIILAFGRAEKYKNLDKTFLLGNKLNIKPIVITRKYFDGQPIIFEYEKLAKENNGLLLVDEPFSLPQYIVKNYNKNMILLVPSKRETFGLIINEIRRFNTDIVLIVVNNEGGLPEQIKDTYDGLIVNLDNIEESANKIKKFFEKKYIRSMNKNSKLRLQNDYDLEQNFYNFFKKVLGDNFE